MNGIELIAAEKHRIQLTVQDHVGVFAALSCLERVAAISEGDFAYTPQIFEWPYLSNPDTLETINRIDLLSKAGAFIAAEIDELVRNGEMVWK